MGVVQLTELVVWEFEYHRDRGASLFQKDAQETLKIGNSPYVGGILPAVEQGRLNDVETLPLVRITDHVEVLREKIQVADGRLSEGTGILGSTFFQQASNTATTEAMMWQVSIGGDAFDGNHVSGGRKASL